ncbi:polysaccharide biosynthesis/export family protein [Phenylobacterium sp.]|jgi:polysaccharide export outer membrane protein|uniref:polysaccharide biosynthesis/export family protein n=1 Tax=Phenylobacterium sp. TaxID=1871053 RepID=UPI002F921D19
MKRLVGLMVIAAASGVVALSGGAAYAQSADASQTVAEYRLGSGDKIKVTTFGEEALTGEFLVSGTGKVSLPLVGEIDAAGQTARQFQQRVEMALKDGYLRDPKVSVEVLNYRPFYILGEVKEPGTYPYTNGLTVKNAVATAGGFTYRANEKRVFIKRADAPKEEAIQLTDTTPVAPGDTIRIVERLF